MFISLCIFLCGVLETKAQVDFDVSMSPERVTKDILVIKVQYGDNQRSCCVKEKIEVYEH